MLVVAGPAVAPFFFRNPHDFVLNVVLFPLGLAGVPSPAASPLPGHVLVTAFPPCTGSSRSPWRWSGAGLLVRHLVRHPPSHGGQVCTLAGWVMGVAILLAPATRVGYLLYPINFFVWGHLLRGAADGGGGILLLLRQNALLAEAGIEQNAERQRQIALCGKMLQRLQFVVEHLTVGAGEVGNRTPAVCTRKKISTRLTLTRQGGDGGSGGGGGLSRRGRGRWRHRRVRRGLGLSAGSGVQIGLRLALGGAGRRVGLGSHLRRWGWRGGGKEEEG